MLDLYKKIIITYKMLNCIQFKWVTKCCSGSCLSPWVWQVLGQSRTTALNQLTPTVTFFQNQITLLQWALQSVQCTTSSGLRTLIWVNKKKEKKKKRKKYSRKWQSTGSNLFRPKSATLTLIPHSWWHQPPCCSKICAIHNHDNPLQPSPNRFGIC